MGSFIFFYKLLIFQDVSGTYLPQFDAHHHSQLSIWYQGADLSFTGQL